MVKVAQRCCSLLYLGVHSLGLLAGYNGFSDHYQDPNRLVATNKGIYSKYANPFQECNALEKDKFWKVVGSIPGDGISFFSQYFC